MNQNIFCLSPRFNGGRRPAAWRRGFTLIELMIVVAIVAILAAVAYPSYVDHVKRGRRLDAQRALMEAAQYMQRHYAGANTYETATLPSSLTKSPPDGATAYTIGTDNLTATAYSLTATPEGPMEDDSCGTLTLDNTGKRDVVDSKGKSLGKVTTCWK